MTISRREFLKGLLVTSTAPLILLTTPQNSPQVSLKDSSFKVISPSQEMERLGQQIVDGFARGIKTEYNCTATSGLNWDDIHADPIADLEAVNNKIRKEIGLRPQFFTSQERLRLAQQSLHYGRDFKEVIWKTM